MLYTIIRKLLFLFPAEAVHHFSMEACRLLCSVPAAGRLMAARFGPPEAGAGKEVFGLPFRNTIGLAAGFDKNAKYLAALETLGFGFIEIGTVTPKPQAGNEKPRLFRLPADKALINRMGFNNEGVDAIAKRLQQWKYRTSLTPLRKGERFRMIIGGNIGKNKITPNEEAWKDYEICFRKLFDYVDYFVVNVSSPNTPGLRALQEKDALKKILSHLQTINALQPVPKPILLKIAPDLTIGQLNDVIALAMEIKLDGIVAANTTTGREALQTPAKKVAAAGSGGLSGKPLAQKCTGIIRYITQQSNGRILVIASGGIFTAADAKQNTAAGAALVQVWTGFVYEGPSIVRNILAK